MVICGIPASHSTHRLFKFLFHIIVVLSLTINIYSNINYISENLSKWIDEMMYPKLNGEKIWNSTINGFSVPRKLMDFFSILLNKMVIIMVPLVFSINYYFIGRWEKIWNYIQKIDHEILASRNFYKNCRYRCIFSILLFAFPFLLVRVYN